MVDWRKIPKIDAHIHLTPKDVIAANIDYDGRFIVNGSIDDYEKIMKYANDHKILIEIHSYPRENLWDDVCSPARIRKAVEKYPNLRLSIAHLGGFQYEELYGLNAYFNLSAVLPDLVDRMGIKNTNKMLRLLGVKNLVFATDYPDSRSIQAMEIYDTYCDILGQMDFTKDEAENICKYNALRMFEWQGI